MSENLFGEEQPIKKMVDATKKKEKPQFEMRLHASFHDKGYDYKTVVSALQKCIRRGKEREACQFAYMIFKTGHQKYLARRLFTITHEDIGVANPQALIIAGQLRTIYNDKDYKMTYGGDAFLPFINLIVLACRGEKTRMGDELTNLIIDGVDKWNELPKIEEDLYDDPHTPKGREKYGYWESGTREESQRRIQLWFDKWAALGNESEIYNPYKEELKKKWGYYDKNKAPIKEDREKMTMKKGEEI